MKQIDVVANKLREDGEITNVWAFHNGILRLSNKIRALKERGWEIEGDYIEGTKNWKYTFKNAPKKFEVRVEVRNGIPTAVLI